MTIQQHNPSHPGEILREYMSDSSVSAVARHLGVTRANLHMILNGKLGISAAMAVKLSEVFPNSDARFWLNLQANYDLAKVRRQKRKPLKPLKPTAATESNAA